MKLNNFFGAQILIVVMVFVLNLLIIVGGAWVCGSLITSIAKRSFKECGNTYPVEKLIDGDWFCAKN